ncbi:MAG: ribonuclease P protein component [Candidatus Margulisiibacteriota bacterium]
MENKLSLKLPKSIRITKEKHFTYIFKNAKKIQNRYLIIYFVPAKEEIKKVAFVASKKLGNAVYRNKCKRRLREFYRLNQHQIINKFDLVFVAKNSIVNTNFWVINEAFIELLKSCNLYQMQL